MSPVLPSPTDNNGPNTGHLLAVFACLFITFLIIAKVVSEKCFLFIEVPVSCSTIIYPLTFLVVHIVTELYGPQQGRILITHGLSISIIVSILLWIARELPIATDSPVSKAAFENVLGSSFSLTMSSLGAYLAGQLLNLHLFVRFQSLFSEQMLPLKSTSASLCAQLVDTILLATALYISGATPASQPPFFSQILSQYALRVLVIFSSTPFLYIGVTLIHRWAVKPLNNTH